MGRDDRNNMGGINTILVTTATATIDAAEWDGTDEVVVLGQYNGAITALTVPAFGSVRKGAKLTVTRLVSATAITLTGGISHNSLDAIADTATWINTGAAWVILTSKIA